MIDKTEYNSLRRRSTPFLKKLLRNSPRSTVEAVRAILLERTGRLHYLDRPRHKPKHRKDFRFLFNNPRFSRVFDL